MTGPEVTAAIELGARELAMIDLSDIRDDKPYAARQVLKHALDVPQMAATIVDHLNTDTLESDSETLVCGGCGHVLVTGDPDDDRDPQAEHATHHAALIRAALIGEGS